MYFAKDAKLTPQEIAESLRLEQEMGKEGECAFPEHLVVRASNKSTVETHLTDEYAYLDDIPC